MQPNMSEQSTRRGPDNDKPPRPTRGQRLAAFGFLGAFGLTILTVLLTGLKVGAPSARHLLQPAPPAADSAPAKVESPSGSSTAEPTSPAPPPPEAAEPRTNESALHEDPAHDRDDGARKDRRRKADESRANDSR
jgi:hypothetical protein